MIEQAYVTNVKTEKTLNLDTREKEHMRRVAELSLLICKSLKLNRRDKQNIYIAASIHDIGKGYIESRILNKPGKLNKSEMEIMKTHVACSVLYAINNGYNNDIVSSVYYHHENYNGTGYYECLKGYEIPLGARVIKVADVFDALTMDRPYRPKLSIQQAINIMEDEKEHFEPRIFGILKQLYRNKGYL